MLHFPPPPHLHPLHGAPPPMPPPIASMPPHMVPASVNRQMFHHQYQTTLARRQLRQQQVSNGGDVAGESSETTPICRCRVIYLGSSVPHVTKDGLQGIQEPLRDLYPEQGLLASTTSESIGIDSWLSVWSNGILIENVDDSGREMKKFFPIDSLHYCAAVRYVVIPGANIDPTESTSCISNTGVTNGLDSLHNKSSFNGEPASSNVASDASELIASTGTSQHVQHQPLNSSPSAGAASSSSHGHNGHSAPVVGTDAKIKFLPLDSPFSRNSNTSIHPPLFACILRRTTGIKVLECHAFICKRDQAANALVRCCFHAYADSMHAKQMEAEMDNEQESTYGAISLSDRRCRRGGGGGHLNSGHSNSPDGPSGDSLGDGSPNYRASSSSSSNAQVNGKSRPLPRENRHHKRSINGSTMSTGQGSIHLNDATANRFSRSISDLDSVENKIEAWRQRSTEALNMEAQQQQHQQHKSSAVEAEIHTESPSSRLSRSRRALSSGAIAVQGTTLAEYRRRRSDDQYSDEEVEAMVDDEDDEDQVETESAHAPKRVNGNERSRNHMEGVYDNLEDEEDEVDEDEDGNYKVWQSRGRRGTDSGVGGVRSSDSTIADAAPSIRSARYQLTGGGSLMYPAAVSTPHLPSLPANHPLYHAGHFIHFNGHRGTIARSSHMTPMAGHLTLAPFPFPPPAHHPAYLMDGRATLRSVRTTASSRAPAHFASGTLASSAFNRPASVATSRSMTNLAPTGSIISPPPPPFFTPHGSPFFPVPSTLSKKELKNLKNTMKKLKKKSKSKGDHFMPFSPPPPGTLPPHHLMRPLPPAHPMALPFPHSNGHPHPHAHHPPPPPFAMTMHPSGRPMPMLMLPHSPPPPPPPPGHMLLQDEPIYVPTMRPMTPISLIPDSSVYNGGGGGLGNVKKDNKKHILNGTSKSGVGKNSSKESSSSRRNSSSPGESISASGSKNNLLHQNYPSVHHSSNNRTCQIDSSSEQEVHSDSSGFNTGGIYRKKANLNERAFSYSIRQESRSRSNSIANVNFPPHSLASGDEDSPVSLAINGDSYSSTASSSLHNAMQRHSLIGSPGVSSANGDSKSHVNSAACNERQKQMNYYNKQNGHKYTDEEISEDFENLTLNGGYKTNGGGAGQAEMYYQQTQMMHLVGRNGYHDNSHDASKVRHTAGGGGGNRCDSSLSSSTVQGNVKTASIKRGSGLTLHQLHASVASNGAAASTTSGSKIALTPVPPIPPHLLANVNGNHSTNGNASVGHMNGGSKVTSRSSSRENL